MFSYFLLLLCKTQSTLIVFFVIYVIIAFILCFVSISFNSISVVSFVGIVIPVRHEVPLVGFLQVSLLLP